MSFREKKKYILTTLSVGLGCGVDATGRESPPSFSREQGTAVPTPTAPITTTRPPVHGTPPPPPPPPTTFSSAVDTPPPCYSSDIVSDVKSLHAVRGFSRIGGTSVVVEIDTDDPYVDFCQSMLQMILEMEIYSKDDLKELLSCFLQLNLPYYHGIIVRAFTEIWNVVHSSGSVYGYGYPNWNVHGMRV